MISKFFIEHPRFAIVISLLFLLSGGIAIMTLPVAQYPNMTPSLVQISTTYPGADAATVQNTVIQPIEAQVNGVKRMLYMSSTATDDGSASVKVTFDIGRTLFSPSFKFFGAMPARWLSPMKYLA